MNMAAVNRPQPAHPGPNGGNLNSRPNSGIPNSGQQDPGLHGTTQDPSHPQHHISARPIFYVPAPPPPPSFLHYQWPMPFSYNPFAGFPGMGYGMVMPPFPPPPYMEAPAYILPNPHIQPVDYRRFLHPQVHAPSAPYQNPNQTRRIRLPHNVPFRETVNSEVQTEPTQRGVGGYGEGSPLVSSDSGHGTTSNSPSSSSSSSQKLGSAEAETYTLTSSTAKDSQVNRNCTGSTVKHGFEIPHHTESKTVQSFIRATLETQKSCEDVVRQENVPPSRNTHCNMWSVSSSDSIVPVCSSSQQEDDVVKGRRVSVPDILMNWGGGTPQETMAKIADTVLPQSDQLLPSHTTEVQDEKLIYQTPTKIYNAEGILSSKDSETFFKILKLPFTLHQLFSGSRGENEPMGLVGLPYRDELLPSLNKSHELPDNEQDNETNPHEETQTDITPSQMSLNGCQIKRKMNESVWSVESLAPFIPTKEWLQKNGMLESDVIIEMTEEAENERLTTQNDKVSATAEMDRRQTRRFSSSDFVPMSDSWLIFGTPGEKQSPKTAEIESAIDASETWGPSRGQAPSEQDSLPSPTHLPRKIILSTPTEEDMGKTGSSEPEANESPNQESPTETEQQEKETLCRNSVEVEKISAVDQLVLQNGPDKEATDEACGNKESPLSNKHLCLPVAVQKSAEAPPLKGHFVDCGIQCTELIERNCVCQGSMSSLRPGRGHPSKYSDVCHANYVKAEGFCKRRKHRWHGEGRNRGQEKQSSQREAYNGYSGKTGKSKGNKFPPENFALILEVAGHVNPIVCINLNPSPAPVSFVCFSSHCTRWKWSPRC